MNHTLLLNLGTNSYTSKLLLHGGSDANLMSVGK